jgi:hypothetical protein
MKSLMRIVREYEMSSKALAIVIMVICRGIIWQVYMWLRSILSAYTLPALSWTICSLYFGSLLCLFLFLLNSGKRYPGMAKDALVGGCLLAVAAVLQDADVRVVLSGKGYGASAWIIFLGASALVISKSVNISRIVKRADEPSMEDESLPAK